MDQFSHDLAVALEETSLLDRAGRVSRWGQRRRTRSTGNLPCAPQPTEDSSSSPTDTAPPTHKNTNIDGLDHNAALPSDSDEKEEPLMRLPKSLNASVRLGTLESDSLNETFSPARFFKPSARRKRKLKRMSMEYETATATPAVGGVPDPPVLAASSFGSTFSATGTIRKRVLKPEANCRSNLFFCGKRKRSNRDRYHDHDQAKASTSVPRHNYLEEYRMRPRSYSSTSKPLSDRLLPLNKGLLSKIERISQQQKTETSPRRETSATISVPPLPDQTLPPHPPLPPNEVLQKPAAPIAETSSFQGHRKKGGRSRRRTQLEQLQFAVDQYHPMDCGELNDFLSSSSLSSSESDDANAANDTDREGDDELTDWPGNEAVADKFDPKRKLMKKSNLPQIKSEDGIGSMTGEDDTLMSDGDKWATMLNAPEPLEVRYQPPTSEPITITGRRFALDRCADVANEDDDMTLPLKQIESEMSGETSNPFLSSPPCQPTEVREIRAGCRRIKGERPGFSIKTSVNERLARFLQDPRQLKIRLPDIEIYEHESLINLATLYSLKMHLDNGCAVLTKTSNTTQSVSIEQHSLQGRLALSDFKRRCYDGKGNLVPRK